MPSKVSYRYSDQKDTSEHTGSHCSPLVVKLTGSVALWISLLYQAAVLSRVA